MMRVATMKVLSPKCIVAGPSGYSITFPCEKGWYAKPFWRTIHNIVPEGEAEKHFAFVVQWGRSFDTDRPFLTDLLQTESVTDYRVTGWMTETWRKVIPLFPRLKSHSSRRTGAQWHIKCHRWQKEPLKYVGGWASDEALLEYIREYIGLSEHLRTELGYLV